nr:MAG TPA: hypothetical protein [Caudoviricetes sp.]
MISKSLSLVSSSFFFSTTDFPLLHQPLPPHEGFFLPVHVYLAFLIHSIAWSRFFPSASSAAISLALFV